MTQSYKDLLAQRQALDLQIKEARAAEVKGALATIHQLIADFGLSQNDIFPAARSANANKGRTVAPKYRDPATGSTWTGRGKAPTWIAGKDRAEFEIK